MQHCKTILDDIEVVRSIFHNLLQILPEFKITDEHLLPYGLKAHTRSVAWIVEQVIAQQCKYNSSQLGIDDVAINYPDTSLHDCMIKVGGREFFVNIKVHNAVGKLNKNDISAVEKLYLQYAANPQYNLIYACFAIHFSNVIIKFDKDNLVLFSPQFLPIYVNPRNDKVQAYYKHNPIIRTRKEFLEALKKASKSIIL